MNVLPTLCKALHKTGKTHIATGLRLKACLEGYKVYFTSVHRLLTQLRESHAQRTLRQMELRFERYDLVICDEFGYISFDKEGAELLFNRRVNALGLHFSINCSPNCSMIRAISKDDRSLIF